MLTQYIFLCYLSNFSLPALPLIVLASENSRFIPRLSGMGGKRVAYAAAPFNFKSGGKATCGLGHRSVRMFCSYMECCDESTHSTWLMWQLGWLYW